MTYIKSGNYMTVTQYAEQQGVSVQYIRRLLGENKIAGAVKIGSVWLIKIP